MQLPKDCRATIRRSLLLITKASGVAGTDLIEHKMMSHQVVDGTWDPYDSARAALFPTM